MAVQFDIHFTESGVPRDVLVEFRRMNEQLPAVGEIYKENVIIIAQTGIETARRAMEFLRMYYVSNPFKDRPAEILFFKVIKPHFHARLMYWRAVYEIELQRPVGGRKHDSRFLKKRLKRLHDFFESHSDFYKYYRSGQTESDDSFFVKTANPLFSTGHDGIVAEIIANDMIKHYLVKSLKFRLLQNRDDAQSAVHTRLQWTASKTGLVELIYALQSGGVFNNGNAMIHEIASVFQEQFGVDLVNYYHTFNEIRLRKKNRTAMLETIREKLVRKMDELDEKP